MKTIAKVKVTNLDAGAMMDNGWEFRSEMPGLQLAREECGEYRELGFSVAITQNNEVVDTFRVWTKANAFTKISR